MYLRVIRTELGIFFGIFGVLAILWVAVCSKLAFLFKFEIKPSLNIPGTIKWPKHQISKKNYQVLF
jgi:hypothetical protein